MMSLPCSAGFSAAIALVLAAFAATGQGPSTGEQDFKRLLAEWNARSDKLNQLARDVKSDEEKEAAAKKLGAERHKYADAFWQLAQEYPPRFVQRRGSPPGDDDRPEF